MFAGLRRLPRTARSLLAAGLVAALAIAALTAAEIRFDRRQRIGDGEGKLNASALALAAQIERDIQSVRLVMASASRLADHYDLTKPGVGREIHPDLHKLALGLPTISNLLLINRQGTVVASSLVAEQAPIVTTDRSYFAFHRDNPLSEARIGENNLSRTLGARVVQITKRIDGPHGDFAGIVLIGLRHDYFVSMFRSFVGDPDGSATLLRADGRLLARYPVPPEAAFDANYAGQALFTDHLPAGPAGSYLNRASSVDGSARYFGYRRVGDLPLVVTVSRQESAILLPWRQEALRKAGVAGLAIACMSGLIAMILVGVFRSERQTRALAASETRFRTLFDSAADAIFLVRPDGTVVTANRQASLSLKLPGEKIAGRGLDQFLVEPTRETLHDALALVDPTHAHAVEGAFAGPGGAPLPVEVRFSRVVWDDEALFLGIARDISERRAYQAQLERLASFDELTQVPKRALFLDRLERALAMARRKDALVGVLFIDLDRFKTINDTLGHAAGDELLQRAAIRLLGALRQVDTVGRYGGDEFVVLLPELQDASAIETVANKLCDVFQAPFDLKGQETVVNASVGIAIFPRDGETGEALVRHADEAMYAAKLAGRNQVRRYLAS